MRTARSQFLVCVRRVLSPGGRRVRRQRSPRHRSSRGPARLGRQYKFSPDAVLLVLASDVYDPADYIRNYDEFRSLIR
jgi:hypothetical protein